MGIVQTAVSKFRTTILIMIFLIIMGIMGRSAMPVASNPNITFPWVTVSVFLEGASPEDMARLVAKPIENRFMKLEGKEEIRSINSASFTNVQVQYDVDYDIDQAILDVERAINEIRNQLPPEAEDPRVSEARADQDYPILSYSVYGFSDLRSGYYVAKDIQERLEKIPGVLTVEIGGVPEELLEVEVSKSKLESLGVSLSEIGNAVRFNNVLIPAGFQDTGSGKFAVEIPSLFETREDVYNLPIKSSGSKVVKLGDVAEIKRTFKDPTNFSRVNGYDAISISVSKRVGFNELDIANKVKAEVEAIREDYPQTLQITPSLDTTRFADDMVNELQGNIITAVILVMILVVATLGLRNGLIVGIAIPFSFLVTFGVLHFFLGYEFNFLVMFGMLLGLGMLIDGGIVIVEYADKLIDSGQDRKEAYTNAAKRMFTPVFASVLTTLAAFSPLMIWPGISGKFMRYLPITVFVVLAASLAYALIFAPVIGSLLGRRKGDSDKTNDSDDTFLKRNYKKAINFAVRNPLETIAYTFLSMFLILGSIVPNYGKGWIYFPNIEPWLITANIQARGNLSSFESKEIATDVESKLINVKGIDSLFIDVRSSSFGGGDGIGRGYIVVEDPKTLDISGWDVLALARQAMDDIGGYKMNIREVQEGPGQFTAPVEIQLYSENLSLIETKTRELRKWVEDNIEGFTGIADTLPKYKIEWKIDVDKERAFQSGISLFDIGSAVQMVTSGIKLGEYRPDDSNEEIDIRARFAKDKRTLSSLDEITVNSRNGAVPVSSFVNVEARPNAASLTRRDGKFFHEISAINKPGYNLNDEMAKVQTWMDETNFIEPGMEVKFGGLVQRGDEATDFLITAFYGALFLMFIILVTQFNSITQPIVILISVLFSTAGVFLGLTITNSEPSTIMVGTALVGLAGIVVNNNIVLIDTFNKMKKDFPNKPTQVLIAETCIRRLRPVLLTTVTTIFGLIFLASGYSIDVINREIFEGTSTVKWYQVFGIAICSGLGFSTIITLLVTPSFLMVLENMKGVREKTKTFILSIPKRIGVS